MALFEAAERKLIADAVARVEEKTAGELVVLHTKSSDDYALYRSVFALLLALCVVDVVAIFLPNVSFSWLLIALALIALSGYRFAGTGQVVRMLVPASLREQKTNERALRAMVEEGVIETRDRSGVLLFLSESERRVVILADSGIHARVDTSEWSEDVRLLTEAFRSGHAAQGVLDVIERIGTLLGEHFPPRTDDENELPNAPREI